MTLPLALINKLADGNPRVRRELEDAFTAADIVDATLASNVAATESIEQATVIVLSSNTAFQNERVLKVAGGIVAGDADGDLTLSLDDSIPKLSGGFALMLRVVGNSDVTLPITGQLATTGNVETLRRKTLDAPSLSGLGNYVDDAAAAIGGIPVGGIYRNGSVLMVRVA
jgi:hypothetical protein